MTCCYRHVAIPWSVLSRIEDDAIILRWGEKGTKRFLMFLFLVCRFVHFGVDWDERLSVIAEVTLVHYSHLWSV
ncbi:uncharacterized protein YALI1_E16841g [Yarrowia lipolytica]|uniref:Uncharacterized protein n=1 Tax=Yarrowia lipolytica TaxID=4952 RepID=A0A1D8NIB4_YARLL|nr:hypothetical protein YALI1_E16841g [Yarrowia lipolytica]